jgi:hypothetical protein
VPVPEISAGVSLAVIAGVLLVTTVSSLVAGRRAPDKDGAHDRVGQAGRPGHGQGRDRSPARARQPGRGGHADEEGWPVTERQQVLPWAGPAPSIGRDGWRLSVRAPADRGRQGVPDMRQDVP